MSTIYLFLTEESQSYPKIEGIENYSIYRKCGKLMRGLRYLHLRSGLMKRFKAIWLGEWKNKLDDFSSIAICDSIFDYTPIDFIRKHRPDVRLICCFRNRVKERINHSIINRQPEVLRNKYGCELWTYSDEDRKTYSMEKYNQFHLIPKEMIGKSVPVEQDVYFIGEDKHRIGRLVNLKHTLEKLGLKTLIEVVADPYMQYTEEEKQILTKRHAYSEVLESVLRSRCIIDIVGKINYGMTFRSLEATVLRKKLITNYKEIKKADFYSPQNIFILGEDKESSLKDFVLSPFDGSVQQAIENYSFEHFCKTIFYKKLMYED